MKISLYIIVLIVHGCFDQTHGLNKLFLHDARALLLLDYNKLSCIFSSILLTRNHLIWDLCLWARAILLVYEKFTRAYLFQIAFEIM